tara:strand:+ start:262 stop:495 length:234 start_codon:yes stop_codon:yes gene_type:complete
MEQLDINNVVEVQEIKELICHRRDLLMYFNELIDKVNIKINNSDGRRCNVPDVDNDLENLREMILESDSDATSDEEY